MVDHLTRGTSFAAVSELKWLLKKIFDQHFNHFLGEIQSVIGDHIVEVLGVFEFFTGAAQSLFDGFFTIRMPCNKSLPQDIE